MTFKFLSFPDGEPKTVSEGLAEEKSARIFEAPTTEDLIKVYGYAWPPSLKIVGFGAVTQTALIERADSESNLVAFLTSGTTASPKLVTLNPARLIRKRKEPTSETLTWGHFFDNSRIASHSVVAHSVASGEILAERPPWASYGELSDFYLRASVNAVACTPSLMRILLGIESFRAMPLRQISLGGELADDSLLRRLGESFPQANVKHIYATTETGSIFSVSDGRAGFPSDLLTRELPGGLRLEIRENQLVVLDPSRDMTFNTGDIVELDPRAERVYFKGRAGDFINVGGRKVSIEKVRSRILSHPEVFGCRVFSVPNRFLGEVVGVEIAAEPGVSTSSSILEDLKNTLEKWELPIVVHWSSSFELSANGKTLNRLGPNNG